MAKPGIMLKHGELEVQVPLLCLALGDENAFGSNTEDKDSKHGMDVWNEGQRYTCLRPAWDAVKAPGILNEMVNWNVFVFFLCVYL